jgi:ATP-dependent RNA helicase DDX54/DBP10
MAALGMPTPGDGVDGLVVSYFAASSVVRLENRFMGSVTTNAGQHIRTTVENKRKRADAKAEAEMAALGMPTPGEEGEVLPSRPLLWHPPAFSCSRR